MLAIFSFWYTLSQQVEDGVVQGYERLARSVAKRPFLWIVFVSAIAAICSVGLLNRKVVVSTEKMWAPSGTTAENDLNYIQSNFGPLNRAGSVLFRAKESVGENVLTLAAFETLWDVHEKIVNEAVGKGEYWRDMCFTRNPQGVCGVYGVLQFWNGNRTYYNSVVKNQMNLLTTINQPTFEGVPILAGGTPVLPNQIYGSITRNPSTQAIVAAKATVQFYFIQQQPIERALAWEKSFDDVAKDSSTPEVNVYHVATSSVDNALSNLDTWPLMALYGIVIVIMLIALQRSVSFTGFRFGLAAVGLGLIALANVAGYGICSGLGVASVTIITVLPMIIIAVGVNDMFIITAAFDAQDSSLSVEDRLAGAMRSCGKSIGFTAVATAAAFYLGALSRFFAVRQFCYYAGTAILCNYVLMVTFFCAAMVIDAQRRDANRWDLLFCVTSPRTQQAVQPFEHVEQDEENLDNALPAASAPPAEQPIAAVKYSDPDSPDSPVNVKAKAVGARAVGDLNYLEYFFSELYYPVLRHPAARLCIVAGFAGIFIANVFGVYRVQQDFEVTQIIPPREPVHQAVVHAREMGLYAPEQSAPVVIAYGHLNYHEQAVQEEIERLQNEFLANTDYNKAPMASWMSAFIQFVRTPGTPFYNFRNTQGYLVNPAIFYTAVNTFITAVPAGKRFRADIVLIYNYATVPPTPIGITSSRANSFHKNLKGPIAITNSMRHAREVMSNSSLVETPRVFAAPYTRAEGFEITVREVIAYYVAVLVAVTGVTFLVVRPHSVVLSLVALVLVAMTMVNFTGNMAWWGLKLDINFISMIFITLSTALVVDYILHVLHHYSQQPTALPPLLRVKEAMVCIGPSLLKGGLTMLVAIIPLAFGRHYVFYVFFRMTFCMVVYSLGHALLLLPAVLPTISFLMCETVGSKGVAAKAVEKDGGVEMLEAGAGRGEEVDPQVVKTENDDVVAFVHQEH